MDKHTVTMGEISKAGAQVTMGGSFSLSGYSLVVKGSGPRLPLGLPDQVEDILIPNYPCPHKKTVVIFLFTERHCLMGKKELLGSVFPEESVCPRD